jgi:hypothetical protein
MRKQDNVFHLAIPTHDLDAAEAFYCGALGCRRARRYDDRITLNFFGDQVVCHLAPDDIDRDPKMYPRHFGVTFREVTDFDAVYRRIMAAGVEPWSPRQPRFVGKREEHETFFVIDPSNNLIEFKYYLDPEMMY